MSKLIYLPFENLPQRYTAMWNDAFIRERSFGDIIVYGTTEERRIINGQFLDINNTVIHKAKQIERVAELFAENKIEDGDVFFVPDIFYPGLTAIKYMAELAGIDVKIVAFNHAGRADKDDFVQKLNSWADWQEEAWHKACDLILVGSQYHKQRVCNYFHTGNKVRVTGAIWSSEWMRYFFPYAQDCKKEDYVIWPHRVCKEKGFELLIDIAKKNPKLNFVITSCGNAVEIGSVPSNITYKPHLTKAQYYKLMAKAKHYLSTARQETFGYTIQEAIYFGCNIVAPNRACYPEYVDSKCLVEEKDMRTPGYLTDLYANGELRGSVQVKDNAKLIYDLCKSL